jgi:RNA recognition motif-containing protein
MFSLSEENGSSNPTPSVNSKSESPNKTNNSNSNSNSDSNEKNDSENKQKSKRAQRNERTIFVGNLPLEITKLKLTEFFKTCGKILYALRFISFLLICSYFFFFFFFFFFYSLILRAQMKCECFVSFCYVYV